MALPRTIALNLESLIGETNGQHDVIAALGVLESIELRPLVPLQT
jgi:hypothetical protein